MQNCKECGAKYYPPCKCGHRYYDHSWDRYNGCNNCSCISHQYTQEIIDNIIQYNNSDRNIRFKKSRSTEGRK